MLGTPEERAAKLKDPGTRDMWLRGVAQDPSDFLASKFAMQLQRREASIEVTQ